MTSTALITGASSGFGATFARKLAAQGFDLILVARREERLKALANEVQRSHGVEAEVLSADLSTTEGVERVERRIESCDTLELIVNNAGFGVPGAYSQVEVHKTLSMIQVHVIASVRLTRAALPGMIARGHGGVINVSSVAAFVPSQGNPTYAATKAYLNAFTEALARELYGTGVKVQALCPGFTITEFHDVGEYEGRNVRGSIPKFLWLDADKVVTASLEALARGRLYCIPGIAYKLVVVLARLGLASFLGDIVARRRRLRV